MTDVSFIMKVAIKFGSFLFHANLSNGESSGDSYIMVE